MSRVFCRREAVGGGADWDTRGRVCSPECFAHAFGGDWGERGIALEGMCGAGRTARRAGPPPLRYGAMKRSRSTECFAHAFGGGPCRINGRRIPS